MKTERLFIRKLEPEDWMELKRIALDFSQSKYAAYDRPLPTDDGELRALTGRFAASNLFFAVFLIDSPKMIGYVNFHYDNGTYDLGFCFHSQYQGKGYAYESCSALLKEIRKNHAGCTFSAGTALKNTPSRTLLEKLGFVCVNTEQLSFCKDADGKDIIFEGGIFKKR